jgi:raffinose/stachyose/melibiose transport system substrate-binding protein
MRKSLLLKPILLALLLVFLGACSTNEENTNSSNTGEETPTETPTETTEESISGKITFLTNRTDLVDSVLPEYAERFNEIYPNINVSFEALTDYEGHTKTRLNSQDYGDVLLIPYMPRHELPHFFEPLGSEAELVEKYLFADEYSFEGITYGLPVQVNTYGAVYNKAVFEEAGITEVPTTPEDFLSALQQIKENTDAIPYYTNFSAGWPLSEWENQRLGIAGDGAYVSQKMPHMDDPMAEGRPHHTLYKVMYDLAEQGLIEEDPFTTDWEQSKQLMAEGKIATMFLGVWAVPQIQGLAANPDDIGYMPFPYTHEDGTQYAAMAGDYKMGINKHSDNKEAARAWLDWFVSESNFATTHGGAISPVKGKELPNTLADFSNVKFIENLPALEGEQDLFGQLDQISEVGFGLDSFKQRIIEAGIGNRNETYADIVTELNQKWRNAREELGLTQ